MPVKLDWGRPDGEEKAKFLDPWLLQEINHRLRKEIWHKRIGITRYSMGPRVFQVSHIRKKSKSPDGSSSFTITTNA